MKGEIAMAYLDEDYNYAIAKTLQKYREKRNYSFERLANKINYTVSRQTLQKYEKKGVRLKSDIWLKICEALEVSPEEFLTEVEKILQSRK
jgi:transcriptional regulator with XRE-family HTH domain